MTNDDSINISRRKILGGLGAVGVGAAGAGLGTTAFLNDTESFENNTIAAGHLDLQVGWEEHYYDGLRNLDDCAASIRVLGDGESPDEGETGFPQRGSPVVAVPDEDVGEFMACTTTESVSTEHSNDPPTGLVELDDVKPGDFGEITLCYSIYNNPGYVQLTSRELGDDEGGQTEPEVVVDDTTGEDAGELGEAIQAVAWYDPGGNNFDDDDDTVEGLGPMPLNELVGSSALLDPELASGTGDWVAQGDGNCHTPGVGCTETLYLTDTGGADAGFDGSTKLYEVTLDDEDQEADLSLLLDLGTTDAAADFTQVDAIAATPDGDEIYLIDKQSAHLGQYTISSDTFTDVGAINGIDGGDEIVLATFSPGGTLYAAGQSGGQYLYEIGDLTTPTETGSVAISDDVNVQGADIVYGSDGTLYLYSSADGKLYTVNPASGAIDLVGTSQSDKGSFTGLAIEDAGTGTLVGSSESADAIIVLDKDDGSSGTEYNMRLGEGSYSYGYGDMTVGAYCPEYCIAIEWWLPRDVGNEVQTDSYSFDLTLQTEQCRHNDAPFTNA